MERTPLLILVESQFFVFVAVTSYKFFSGSNKQDIEHRLLYLENIELSHLINVVDSIEGTFSSL